MKYNIFEIFAVIFIIGVNILFYARKGILSNYGYGFNIFDLFGKDRKRLKKVINEIKNNPKMKFYKLINFSIPFLFISSIIMLIISFVLRLNANEIVFFH